MSVKTIDELMAELATIRERNWEACRRRDELTVRWMQAQTDIERSQSELNLCIHLLMQGIYKATRPDGDEPATNEKAETTIRNHLKELERRMDRLTAAERDLVMDKKKIQEIKSVRERLGLPLKEAKDLVDEAELKLLGVYHADSL